MVVTTHIAAPVSPLLVRVTRSPHSFPVGWITFTGLFMDTTCLHTLPPRCLHCPLYLAHAPHTHTPTPPPPPHPTPPPTHTTPHTHYTHTHTPHTPHTPLPLHTVTFCCTNPSGFASPPGMENLRLYNTATPDWLLPFVPQCCQRLRHPVLSSQLIVPACQPPSPHTHAPAYQLFFSWWSGVILRNVFSVGIV